MNLMGTGNALSLKVIHGSGGRFRRLLSKRNAETEWRHPWAEMTDEEAVHNVWSFICGLTFHQKGQQ